MADKLPFNGPVEFNGAITASTRIRANAGFVFPQSAEASTPDTIAAVTAANIVTQIVTCTPSTNRSKNTDTAANLISTLQLTADNDAFDFSFINLATDGSSAVTLTAPDGNVTLVGSMVIQAQDNAENNYSAGVARFRVRRTSSTAVTIYRIG